MINLCYFMLGMTIAHLYYGQFIRAILSFGITMSLYIYQYLIDIDITDKVLEDVD